MRRREILQMLASAPLAGAASAQTRYEPNWESLDRRPCPRWYTDGRFGIIIHWGLYSVPAYAAVGVQKQNPYAERYWHSLTDGMKAATSADKDGMTWEYHKRVYGAAFAYSGFAPMFRAENYDPDHWADVFARSGLKYVVLTSKHHDGFTLWGSAEASRSWGRPWNAVDTGPKRDVLTPLMEAGRRRNLKMGIYYSLYEWYNPLWLSDKKRYVTEHMIPQFKDVVNRAKPSIVFSDGEWDLTSAEWRSPELLAWLFNESPVRDEVAIDDRWGKDTRHRHGGYYTTEYTSGLNSGRHPWEEGRGMGESFGYNRMETLKHYRTGRELVLMLIDLASRGGNLLLGIGPTADGRIPVIMEERLIQIGDWLRPNGEAIHGTRMWRKARQWSSGTIPKQEEKEYRAEYDITEMVDAPPPGYARVEAFLTATDGAVYAIVPRRPVGEIVIDDVEAPAGVRATLIGGGERVDSRLEGRKLRLRIPERLSASLPAAHAYTFKLAGAR